MLNGWGSRAYRLQKRSKRAGIFAGNIAARWTPSSGKALQIDSGAGKVFVSVMNIICPYKHLPRKASPQANGHIWKFQPVKPEPEPGIKSWKVLEKDI